MVLREAERKELLKEKEEEAQMVRAAQECVGLREQCADLHRSVENNRLASKEAAETKGR